MYINIPHQSCFCSHCYHLYCEMIHRVIPEGSHLEQCCKCDSIRTVSNYHHDYTWYKPYRAPKQNKYVSYPNTTTTGEF